MRVADLQSSEPSRTISYPFDGAAAGFGFEFTSRRHGDVGAISPDGRFICFILRPELSVFYHPTNTVVVHDRDVPIDPGNLFDAAANDAVFPLLNEVSSATLSADGNLVVVATTDQLDPADGNGLSDIYLFNRTTQVVKWISDPQVIGGGNGRSFDPAISPDGSRIVFISTAGLLAGDVDGRETIYTATNSDSFDSVTAITTGVRPLALAVNGISAGGHIAFLGQLEKQSPKTYLRDLGNAGNTEIAVTPRANGASRAPALSLDGSTVAIVSAATNLVRSDTNKSTDVFAGSVASMLGLVSRELPVAMLSGFDDGTVVEEGASVAATVSGADASGSVVETLLEAGSELIARAPGSVVGAMVELRRGIYSIGGAAFNDVWLAGSSPRKRLIVAAEYGITGAENLIFSLGEDGGTVFSADVRIDNRRAEATGNLRLLLLAQPAAALWQTFGNFAVIAERMEALDELIVGTFDLAPLGSQTGIAVPVAGISPPTEAITGGVLYGPREFQGIAWVITAILQENVGGLWQIRDRQELFRRLPLLDEDTPGPNLGIPPVGDDDIKTDVNLNPQTLLSLGVAGPGTVPEKGRANFRATATYASGTKECAPRWSLENAAGAATITTVGGILVAGNVSAPRKLTVRADFGGLIARKEITIHPVSPVISVRAAKRNAIENGASGQFKILRSTGIADPLEVRYEIQGEATPGVDYTALTGVVTFAPRETSKVIEVTPLDDTTFEGNEVVRIVLSGATEYRLGKTTTASVTITDDEAIPENQPDAIIRSGKSSLGAFVFNDSQTLRKEVAVKKTAKFVVAVVNRSAVPSTFELRGDHAHLGIGVRYLLGKTDITAAVTPTGGAFGTGYLFPDIPSGEARQIVMEITPTDAAPVGLSTSFTVRVLSGVRSDEVSALVTRVR